MKQNAASAIGITLRHEGGFVDHPKDPGGATNRGITLTTLSLFLSRKATVADLKNMSDVQVFTIYRKYFWDRVKADSLPGGLDLCVFDFAVNSGPQRAAMTLQRLVGAEADGSIGPKTLAAVEDYVSRETLPKTIERYQAMRLLFLEDLPHFDTFGRGWTRRVNEVLDEAMLMMREEAYG